MLAVLAAACVVAAFSLALLYPPTLTLARLISLFNHDIMVAMQDLVRDHVSEWLWREVFIPVLSRPCWLLPLAMGLVLGGAALTAATNRGVSGSPRWRN